MKILFWGPEGSLTHELINITHTCLWLRHLAISHISSIVWNPTLSYSSRADQTGTLAKLGLHMRMMPHAAPCQCVCGLWRLHNVLSSFALYLVLFLPSNCRLCSVLNSAKHVRWAHMHAEELMQVGGPLVKRARRSLSFSSVNEDRHTWTVSVQTPEVKVNTWDQEHLMTLMNV